MVISIEADLVQDQAVFESYRDGFKRYIDGLMIWPERKRMMAPVVSFIAHRLILTTGFVLIDPARNAMMINQSYSQIERIYPHKFPISDGKYRAEINPIFIPGRSVVLGGPIDGVWYHWLFSWCPRILLMQMLRPALMSDPGTKFIVHPAALSGPFGETLATFGIPPERLLPLDLTSDYELEEVVVVPFLDQNILYPKIIAAFRDHLMKRLDIRPKSGRKKRIFTSRQSLPAPKRRIENFDDFREIVENEFEFEIADMGQMTAVQQISLFSEAEYVLGAHGSDLSNILFCRPGTKIIVIESAISVNATLHRGLEYLCEVLELEYHRVEADLAPYPGRENSNLGHMMRSDYIVNVSVLKSKLKEIIDQGGEENNNCRKIFNFFKNILDN